MEEPLILQSSIKSSLMRFVLLRGTFLAAMGGLILVLSGIFFSGSTLSLWGFFIFFLAMSLITLGLLPYRRLRQLETNPYQLISQDQTWHFQAKGQLILSLPMQSIAHTIYVDNHAYGIGIFLKHPLPQKIVIHQRHFNIENLRKGDCDLFFPYFSRRAYSQFLELQNFATDENYNPD